MTKGTDDWNVPDSVKSNPLFIEIGTGTVIDALKQLNTRMIENKLGSILSDKQPHLLFGYTVETGNIGLIEQGGKPLLLLKPGQYWNFDPTQTFRGKSPITSHLEFMGLTIAQVGQSEALVVQDPQNRAFVIRNGGFVAYGAQGTFKILEVVDTLNLGPQNAIKEYGQGRILGWKHEIHSTVTNGSTNIKVVVATFLNVPANNVAILQQKNTIVVLKTGQHVITNPNTTFRSFFSLGERQHAFKTQPAYTVEGVPVILSINMRYRIFDPILLTANYDDPLMALINPAQTAVNGVVSKLSYQQFMRARKVEGESESDAQLPWLEVIKADCMNDLLEGARLHGIEVISFEVMDRQLEGHLGKDLERQAESVLQNQIEATQIELKNHINTEKQKGVLQVAQIQAEALKTQSDTQFYQTTKDADAKYYEMMREAAAKAETSALITQQEAKNIVALAEASKKKITLQGMAYAAVPEGHAQRVQETMIEIDKRKAMPKGTFWFESKAGVSSSSKTQTKGAGFVGGV
ncbi:hypothetical protein BC833DRAFT_535857 [Globomyces pollinis-pini]|nr:hypothetical protein BC833DRAFT_535857 [Globomyces pollinis-pini]